MKKSSVPLLLALLMLVSVIATLASYWLYERFQETLWFWVGQVCFACSMQLVLMHLTAPVVRLIFRKAFDYQNVWFREKKFEKKLYHFLRVRQWREKLPSYDLSAIGLGSNSPQQLVQNMCHFEVVHESIAVVGFLPMLFACYGLNFYLLLAFSLLFALLHLCFVAVQRLNRSYVVKLMGRKAMRRRML